MEVHISTASSTPTLNSSVERQKPIPESPVIFILFFFTVAKRKVIQNEAYNGPLTPLCTTSGHMIDRRDIL
jgi:hypothetical protein